ncbi:MAG TPA: hypothetical protein PLW35_15145, partial [Verrucomicrobiota bacterium]|nr:hypothetical protein [Verrucomicrobiota bacterium]
YNVQLGRGFAKRMAMFARGCQSPAFRLKSLMWLQVTPRVACPVGSLIRVVFLGTELLGIFRRSA